MATRKKQLVLQDIIEATVTDGEATVTPTVTPTMPNKGPVEIIEVPIPLEDVQLQAGLFRDREPGRYILQYNQGWAVLPISVYWTGSEVVA
jgi:hypothetical protein